MPHFSNRFPVLASLLWMLALLGAVPAQAENLGSGKLRIVAANYPLAYFAEHLAGTRASVVLPIPAGEDPAYWRPDAKAIGQMQKADLILLNGATHEKWLPQVSLPRLKTVDTSAGFRDAHVRIENAIVHSHGPGGMHSHEGIAVTTWLDFDLAGKQAQAVAEALVRKRPEWKSLVLENLQALRSDLAALDGGMQAIVKAKPDLPLLASHPVYQYLARRYGLNLKSLHWEASEMPPPEEWVGLPKTLSAHPARWMLWESPPTPEIMVRLKGLGVGSVVFEPCANRPASGDFLAVMRQNLENLRAAYR